MCPGRSYLRQREESLRTAKGLLREEKRGVYIHEAGQRIARVCGELRLNRKKSRSGARLVVLWGPS